MSNQLKFTDSKGLKTWCDEFYKKVGAANRFTRSYSLCTEIPGEKKWEPSGDSKANNAVIAKMVHDRLKVCAPIKECAWTACEHISLASLKWFEVNKKRPILAWSEKYDDLKNRMPTYDEVKAYQAAALKWREDIKYGQIPLTRAITDHVVTEYKVNGGIVMDLNQMLRDMIDRRKRALGIEGDVERKPATHIKEFADWLERKNWCLPCPWDEWAKVNKSGHSLAVTACAGMIQRKMTNMTDLVLALNDLGNDAEAAASNGEYVKEKCEEVAAFFKGLPKEVEKFMQGTGPGQTGPFVQQGSALDTAFSSYFWAWKSGVTGNSFPGLSNMLFELGKNPTGRSKLEKKLKQSPFRWAHNLVDLFATVSRDSESIHLHPGVLTPGRLCTEMVCSFGAFPVTDPARIVEGSSSPRFVLNLKTDESNPAATSICNMFREYRTAFSDWQGEEVVPTEHLLHQTFLNKHGPFINVSQVKGKALDVLIVGE
ncbi:N [Wanowrie virus]|nr:N [Wanowrie virus] [Wanowrie virus]